MNNLITMMTIAMMSYTQDRDALNHTPQTTLPVTTSHEKDKSMSMPCWMWGVVAWALVTAVASSREKEDS